MDNKAMYRLSYGVFMLSTSHEGIDNGCITNTCIQVASNPTRFAISVLNTNYTCELIKKSRILSVSVLDETCTFDTIKYFGFQSGRDTDKLGDDLPLPRDTLGIKYLNYHTCAVFSGKVVGETDLGSHTLFVFEVVDGFVQSDKKPITYDYYQNSIKPKKKADDKNKGKKIKGYRCKICGYVYEGETLPEDFTCPLCGHDKTDFEPIYE